jgi:uncharacterized membrane protein YcaP (DUF421 family)
MEPNLPPLLLLLSVAARTAIAVIVLIIAVRLVGRRSVGEMNLMDVITILLVGNAVQNALTFGSGKITVSLVSAAVLLLVDGVIGGLVSRHPWLQHRLAGEPAVLYCDGRLDRRLMKHEGVEEEELLAAARAQGLPDLKQVHLAILEENGSISVIPK